jgi:hypothetical protein
LIIWYTILTETTTLTEQTGTTILTEINEGHNSMRNQIRQGDVLLEETNMEEHNNKKLLGAGRRVLAYGEVTGHSHVLDGNIRYYENNGTIICQIEEGVLSHEEHGNINIPKGDYIVINQREHDVMTGIRMVID